MQKRTFTVALTEETERMFRYWCLRSRKVDLMDTFDGRVGILDGVELFFLGIRPENFSGSFRRNRLKEIKEFCDKNPCYHIVSLNNMGVFVNRVLEDATLFKLADGDANPNLQAANPAGSFYGV